MPPSCICADSRDGRRGKCPLKRDLAAGKPLPSVLRSDGRPLWEPPYLDVSDLIGEEYLQKRKAFLAFTGGKATRATELMDISDELQLIADWVTRMMNIFIVDGLDAFILDTNIGIKPLDYLWKKANARALLILDLNNLGMRTLLCSGTARLLRLGRHWRRLMAAELQS